MIAHSHISAAAALALSLTFACGTGTASTAIQPANNDSDTSTAQPSAEVKLTAKKTAFKKSVLNAGETHSCVKVTVTNQREGKNLPVNPLYFSLTDTSSEKHEALDALGGYEDQIETTTLAPGEKVSGTVCGKGEFTPKTVAFTDELMQEIVRSEVS